MSLTNEMRMIIWLMIALANHAAGLAIASIAAYALVLVYFVLFIRGQ